MHFLLLPLARLTLLLAALFILPLGVSAVPFSAYAQASHVDTPLMVVRFNQARVYYQKPLFSAVKQAFKAKPSVHFNVISLVPVGRDKAAGARLGRKARTNTSNIVQAMVNMGVPQSRINVQYRQQNAIRADEVHIFVE